MFAVADDYACPSWVQLFAEVINLLVRVASLDFTSLHTHFPSHFYRLMTCRYKSVWLKMKMNTTLLRCVKICFVTNMEKCGYRVLNMEKWGYWKIKFSFSSRVQRGIWTRLVVRIPNDLVRQGHGGSWVWQLHSLSVRRSLFFSSFSIRASWHKSRTEVLVDFR